MLRRLETMVLMTGYEPAAAGDPRADRVGRGHHRPHRTAQGRHPQGRHITEVYGIEDDEILTQDIFDSSRPGVKDGKIEGQLAPTGIRPTFMEQFKKSGVELAKGEFGIPPEDPKKPIRRARAAGER
jgi:pilus assembly protein CpaF